MLTTRLGLKPVQVRNKCCDIGIPFRRKRTRNELCVRINMPKRLSDLAGSLRISPGMLARRLLHIIERDDMQMLIWN